ncbi:MAG: MazF family transcriptional regulator [Candidatus Brocadia sp.]|nr:Endoribonuclease MazF9 [Anaerolineales bacterium]MCC6325440.1 type II toxin-antitoxin system PemK/MazF family toxin [Candidatus Brocadia sp.]MCE7912798.1 type II toxin-antitoxin system PemK/MazF family toxin [Candidatus Brocadia sp. AMX3]MDG5997850.1 type II toxin-antitoxin system PemK/MazF family toxin [Candidatus Brocadia sp.]RIJ93222.1 MAG: MazF family transcriptional regulator [Candidatus Brocadia sp.]
MKRGDIYLVDFEPSVGAEIKKQRPALIISCNEANKHLKTVMAIPFSSKVERVFPFEVFVKKNDSRLDYDSKLKIPQMRAVDKSRLKRYIGTLGNDILEQVEDAIKIHLAID